MSLKGLAARRSMSWEMSFDIVTNYNTVCIKMHYFYCIYSSAVFFALFMALLTVGTLNIANVITASAPM